MQDYRKLRVWAKAHALASETRAVGRGFPKYGFGALHSQMVRAAESILFNIAEGCGAESPKDFARFLEISCKSSMELQAQFELARDYRILKVDRWAEMNSRIVTIRSMLWGLRRKVLTAKGR